MVIDLFMALLNATLGFAAGVFAGLVAFELAKHSGGRLSERFAMLAALLGLLVGTGFGVALFGGPPSPTPVWLAVSGADGSPLLGYGSQWYTYVAIRKHPERYTD